MYKKITLQSIILTLSLSTSVMAFDDKREGFIVGLGAGIHNTNYEISSYYGSVDDSEIGFATSLKIGYGFSEQFSLYYVRNASWYKPADYLLTSGIMGIGGTYYILPETETWYLNGAVGIGDFTNVDESEAIRGSAYMIGAGYEIKKHIQIEGNILITNIDDDYEDLETTSFQLTVNYQWY